jgi:ophiobolin F synthase
MIAFGQGTRMTDKEFEMIEPVIHAAERVFLATNDFYSWHKEKVEPIHRIWNAVLLFMKTESLSEQEALSSLKTFIIGEEQRFLDERARFCTIHYNISPHLKRMINALEPAIGGYHYWCTVCPRQNAWKANPPPPFKMTILMGELKDGYGVLEHDSSRCHLRKCRPGDESVGLQNRRTHTNGISARLASCVLTDPVSYVRSMASKNVRSQFVDAINFWLGVPRETIDTIKDAVSTLHHSSLILDDIQDQSLLRRGKIATHQIYGEAQAINSATYMFVEATKRIHALREHNVTSVLLDGLENLFLGQALDLNWKTTIQCPSKDDYLAMVDQKTGSMFRLIFRMLTSSLSENTKPIEMFDKLARLLGQWYQVRDDYMNLKGGDYTKQKGFCEDLDEGKLSYPIICCHALDPFAGDMILGIFRRRSHSTLHTMLPEAKEQILEVMEQSGALCETFSLIKTLQREAEAEITSLEQMHDKANPMLRLLVLTLSDIPK